MGKVRENREKSGRGWRNTKGKQERGEIRQGRGDTREERINNHIDDKQTAVRSYKKEEKILERESNQMKKRNLKWKKLEEGRRHETRKGGNQAAGCVRNQKVVAKVRLASREGNSQVSTAPTPVHRSPGSSKRYLQNNKTVCSF